jgi:3-isopropylmalate/(R)-2-methylmalate dehydratase small subunit
MSQVRAVSGRGLPLRGDDIDTDRIIPARYLRSVTFNGLGEAVFADDRTQAAGSHPFDQPQYQGAKVLVVNRNFGCGSSREHAPQAIARWGIVALLGESFAEIFLGNCVAIGVPCLTATAEVVKVLQDAVEFNPQVAIELDLATLEVRCGEYSAPIQMAEGPRQMFLSGTWDACSQLVAQAAATRSVAAKLPYLSW